MPRVRRVSFALVSTAASVLICGSLAGQWTSPGSKRDAKREGYVQQGWPFTVRAEISDADFTDQTFDFLRQYFLARLAKSPNVGLIERVRVVALSGEGFAWTCSVDLKDDLGVIAMTHFGAFYDEHDPHKFDSAARYTLEQLNRVHRRAGSRQ
jgi:hypothetical protein